MEPSHPPSVDSLSRRLPPALPAALRVSIARAAADASRAGDGEATVLADEQAKALLATRQTPVINATGVILHTNLGRSLLDPDAAARASAAATNYTNLELDLGTGRRGGRTTYAVELLRALTGAGDALVVNNNASALFLVLLAMASGRSVPVSRGELIEIGGSYRLPDLMSSSGTTLIEIGTTNRTRIADYAAAIDTTTALLLKVHPSNYRVEGFTEEADLASVSALGHERSLPSVFDAGSGLLDDRTPWLDGPTPTWLAGEPGVVQALDAGADLVLFSGDKLLGGPQAGIIVGHPELVAGLRRHPVARALRVDGPTLAALETTLEAYADGRADRLPLWRMATIPETELRRRCEAVAPPGATVEQGASTIGAGSVPGSRIPTPVIRVAGRGDAGHRILLEASTPVVARREAGDLVVDLRTVHPDDDEPVRAALEIACRS